jgi:hypothetical protein
VGTLSLVSKQMSIMVARGWLSFRDAPRRPSQTEMKKIEIQRDIAHSRRTVILVNARLKDGSIPERGSLLCYLGNTHSGTVADGIRSARLVSDTAHLTNLLSTSYLSLNAVALGRKPEKVLTTA